MARSILYPLCFTLCLSEITFDTCIVSEYNSCELQDMNGPTFIYPGGKTRCVFDTNVDEGTNSTYRYEVYPGIGQDRNKVVMFFQGGGGCFNDATCDYTSQKTLTSYIGFPTFSYIPFSEAGNGIFNRQEPSNPFRTWTIVQVAFCTGDIHAGTRVLKGKVLDTHLNGVENTLAVWRWIERNLPSPDHFVLSGTSAGSLGAQTWFNFIMNRIDLTKTQVVVLLDSFVSYVPPSVSKVVLYLGGCDERLEWDAGFMEKCLAGTLTLVDLVDAQKADYPTVPHAFISSKQDSTERFFYCLVQYGNDVFSNLANLGSCILQPAFLHGKFEVLGSYVDETDTNNVISYWSNSNVHGFLNKNFLYTENNGNEDGISLVDWINLLIADNRPDLEIPSYCTVGPDGVDPEDGQSYEQYCDTFVTEAVYIGKDERKDYENKTDLDKVLNWLKYLFNRYGW